MFSVALLCPVDQALGGDVAMERAEGIHYGNDRWRNGVLV